MPPQDKPEPGARPDAGLMNMVAETLDDLFNGEDQRRGSKKQLGFVLLVFPFDSPKGCNFVGNGANRWDIVRLFKDIIARWEEIS